MNVLIITGGSKGIGKAIAQKYTSENYQVFSIARSASNNSFTEITTDLSNPNEVSLALEQVFKTIYQQEINSITLINNAGMLGEVNTIENLSPENITKVINLNTTAPLILSSQFIKHTKALNCKKQIINISSGAATSPYHGWSVYCTTKASIDMLTRTSALEQSEIKHGVKCVAIYPGVVDTNMQTQIRDTSETEFKNVQRFIELKENNELYTPEFVADRIYKIDTSDVLSNGDIVDIRKF